MSTIFPLREKVSLDDGREPRLVDLEDDVADEVFQALSSGTTRQIFSALHETPQTASDLADVTDTSVQNVQYHLEKLADADLVDVVDTWYSERGTEMKVYAPTDEALVLFAGRDKQSSLRSLLKRVVGALAVLLPAGGAVTYLARQYGATTVPTDGGGQGEPAPASNPVPGNGTEPTPTPDGGVQIATDEPTPEATEQAPEILNETVETVNTTTPTPENASAGADVAMAGVDPVVVGVAFVLGGLLVLGLVAMWSGRW
jgi:DNA-binding transcriptional ArsR family regulator